MTRQERRLVAALVGEGRRRWIEGMELGVVWAEVRREGTRGEVMAGKGKKGRRVRGKVEGKR